MRTIHIKSLHERVQPTQYGEYIHLANEMRMDYTGSSYYRVSDYHSKLRNETFREDHFAASLDDDTNIIDRDKDYNSKCSCCFLGFSHTELKHNNSIKNSQQ